MIRCKDCRHFYEYGNSQFGAGECGLTLPPTLRAFMHNDGTLRTYADGGCDLGQPKESTDG